MVNKSCSSLSLAFTAAAGAGGGGICWCCAVGAVLGDAVVVGAAAPEDGAASCGLEESMARYEFFIESKSGNWF